jgi:acetolactate synthase-1/2/3 large subunit
VLTEATCWRAIVDAMKAERIKYVFGIPSDGVHLYKDLADFPEIEPVLVRHETSAVLMAMGFSRITNDPTVCYASPGPGVANLVPGLLEAYSACTPIIALGSATKIQNDQMGGFQENDQVGMVRAVTKWAYRLTLPEKAGWAMNRAFTLATNGRPGPIYIDVPKDIGMQVVNHTPYHIAARRVRASPDSAKIGEAVDLIGKSAAPIVVAGGGVIASQAFEELRLFAELIGAPIFTTPSGRGSIPEDHPLSMGLVGLYRTRVNEQVYEAADLIIGLGSRYEEFQTGEFKFFPSKAKLIQVDIEPNEFGRNWTPTVAVMGDVKLVLQSLITRIKQQASNKFTDLPRIKTILKQKEEYEKAIEAECRPSGSKVKTKQIVRELNKVFGHGTILANENGGQDLWSYYCPYYKVLDINSCVAPGEQTIMGFGVTASIGAKLAAPDRNVVCTTGDGAFQMFMKEIATAVQYKAPVTWTIFNNYSLHWVKYIQRGLGLKELAVDFTCSPDFTKIAEAYKCYGIRIERPSEIRPALEGALKSTREGVPAIVDCIIDTWDYPENFVKFHQQVWDIPRPRAEE